MNLPEKREAMQALYDEIVDGKISFRNDESFDNLKKSFSEEFSTYDIDKKLVYKLIGESVDSVAVDSSYEVPTKSYKLIE